MNPKVLLVDDSAVMRKIILRPMDEVGDLLPTEAADGAVALELFKKNEFDLILTDWNMPNMNGLEMVREIRAMGSKVPIIMITTEAEKGRMAEAIHAGVSDYLVKPFDRDKLRTKLEQHMAAGAGNDVGPQWFPEFSAGSNDRGAWAARSK
jgi:two-component system, chemotaxis family, chemotaxis protein CheY